MTVFAGVVLLHLTRRLRASRPPPPRSERPWRTSFAETSRRAKAKAKHMTFGVLVPAVTRRGAELGGSRGAQNIHSLGLKPPRLVTPGGCFFFFPVLVESSLTNTKTMAYVFGKECPAFWVTGPAGCCAGVFTRFSKNRSLWSPGWTRREIDMR